MNVMQFNPTGDMFIGFIDTTGSTKDTNYITTKVKRYIARVDLKNIVQVCFYNVAAIKNIANIINWKWPHILASVCNSLFDLLLKDWRNNNGKRMLWTKQRILSNTSGPTSVLGDFPYLFD